MKKKLLVLNIAALLATSCFAHASQDLAGCPCKSRSKDKDKSFVLLANKLPIEDEKYIDEVSNVDLLACDCGHEEVKEEII